MDLDGLANPSDSDSAVAIVLFATSASTYIGDCVACKTFKLENHLSL